MRSDPIRRRLLGALAGAAALPAATRLAMAAPRVEPFGTDDWPRLRDALPRPAVVFFTTTYCSTCPEVLETLRNELRARRVRAPLVAVVLDGDALDGHGVRHAAHLGRVDRLFAYRGREAVLRHAVDPSWRGVTPYVALLGTDGSVGFGAGTPAPDRLDAWLSAGRAVASGAGKATDGAR